MLRIAILALCLLAGGVTSTAEARKPARKSVPEHRATVPSWLPAEEGPVRAFPGAEGGGMYTVGGRGGRIVHVTSLADDGSKGTLRHALKGSGARTIVFDVAGTIELQKPLDIKCDSVTLAGQTAPGEGICISRYPVRVRANQVIIRYMRFRLGDTAGIEADALGGRYCDHVMIDHCSVSWSTDECASFYGNRNFTMQWCIVSESLRTSVHGKGKHGYGGLWGGRDASFHHNLVAHHDSRNARIDHPGIYDEEHLATHRGAVDLRNNVIYNWGGNTTYGGEDGRFNVVGNYYKPGPASKKRAYFVDAYWHNGHFRVGSAYPQLYLANNYHAGSYASALNADNWQGGVQFRPQSEFGDAPSQAAARLDAPLPIVEADGTPCTVTTHTATEAYEAVLQGAGASLRRDAVDRRVVEDVRTGGATVATGSRGSTGGLIDSQEDAGGWPALTATPEEVLRTTQDSDGDGIPDFYEQQLGLNPADPADASAGTIDPAGRYSNFEAYLHYILIHNSQFIIHN